MSVQKKVPEKPSDLSGQNLKFLRFVDPEDSTKIFELAAVDTGDPAGDGTRRYSLVTGGLGGPSPSLPTSIPANPPVAVTAAAVALPTNTLVNSVMIRAPGGVGGNIASVWIGGDNTVTIGSGYELVPGSWVSIPIDNLDKIFIIGNPADFIQWIGG